MHSLGAEKCDNCDCSQFRLDRSRALGTTKELTVIDDEAPDPSQTLDSKVADKDRGSVIVGIEQHEFVGSGDFCIGILGYAPTSPMHNTVCNLPRTANIHKTINSKSSLKDSGERLEFGSGMVRDVEYDKPGFHFLIPKDIPFDAQMLTRVARHLREGAKKYTPRNWEKGNTDEEAERARESALRHMMQWVMGETDEDHAAAVIINVLFAETMQYKANNTKETG
jgi:hypothetical protein